ncbi:regulator of ribonuclease activity A [Actimicrobium sp. GrIS 1.19]|uniref:ribonuclease E activity regulator RraA n=1 Tax=Actimicrobium sp. GrIS 1.19 TaxID=3071708 RepID=UPI002E0AE0C1|nr:regulator of ribonuclease activity A [Actimicrobium sp. GrIS 1.19]
MNFATCDLCDANEDRLSANTLLVMPPVFRAYGRHDSFSGPAATLKVFEDNVLVRTALESAGAGRVLMIDAGDSLRYGMVGGNLGKLAQTNGWAGIVITGCIRDVTELDACAIGIRALGVHPRRSQRNGAGAADLVIAMAGVTVRPGDWIYVDADGVLVSHDPLH